MFWVVFLLLFLGILLILLEAALPFGLSFMAGVLVIAFSIYYCFVLKGPVNTVLYMMLALPLAMTASWFVLRSGIRWLTLSTSSETSNPAESTEISPEIGAELEVIQPLRPTGAVEWNNRRFAARTLHPEQYVKAGEMVRLRARDSIYLLVEPDSDGDASGDPSPPKAKFGETP